MGGESKVEQKQEQEQQQARAEAAQPCRSRSRVGGSLGIQELALLSGGITPPLPPPNPLTLDGTPAVPPAAPAPPKATGEAKGSEAGSAGQSHGKTAALPGTFGPAQREYWREFVNRHALADAKLLNVIPAAETNIGALPADVVQLCAEQVTTACRRESERGGRRSPDIGQDVVAAIWNALKQHTREGEGGYVGHLIGPIEARREFERRIGEGMSVPRGTHDLGEANSTRRGELKS